MTSLSRRSLLLGTTAAGAALALSACTRTAQRQPNPVASPSSTAAVAPAAALAFRSGASCIGAADGEFGRWRGTELRMASTWVDDGALTPIVDEFRRWDQSIDFASQYEFKGRDPFSWKAVAAGSFDSRFRSDLRKLRSAWGDRTGFLDYRFQHEFNGDWYPWSVTESTAGDFIAGWRRFADLFKETMDGDPRFRLVWCANGGTPSKGVQDIRTLWPGDDVVDVVGVDYYDFFSLQSAADWEKQRLAVDSGGGPVGIDAWQRFAEDHGKQLGLPEWGNQYGDNPRFIDVIHEFVGAHLADSTTTPGAVAYEVYFNQVFGNGSPSTEGDFRLQVDGEDNPQRPRAAAEYRRLWRDWPVA